MQDDLLSDLEKLSLFHPGDRVLVAVSGGADSVVLLHLLLELSRRVPLVLQAAHLDHGMRPESAQDAAFVGRLCQKWGVALASGSEDVPALARQAGGGLEDAARQARRRFLCETAERSGCGWIALGQHRDDQAETFLHRLLRGSGTGGLAAMRQQSPPFVRPLLHFERSRLRAYLRQREIPFVEDPSNADPRFTRNRIRHDLLPRLREFNPRIEEQLADLCASLALEEDFWRRQEEPALAALAMEVDGGLALDHGGLLELHPALRPRVLRGAIARVRGGLTGISRRHIEALDGLLLGDAPQAEAHLPGLWAGRRYDRLLLRRQPPAIEEDFSLQISGPGVYLLPQGRVMTVSIETDARGEGPLAVEFAADRVGFPLVVRNFRPGDRFRPAGGRGEKKLKDFYIDAKLERERRAALPLVVGREVLWVVGIRRCDGMRPEPGGGKVLRMVVTQQNLTRIGL
ncbi:tRNA(Ile)-lysidine synthase [Desulfuromonas versatilis]|uniref:tRNA(Ile)-lysidine synthase n=1 Tax=Desulfuromonas versatilis TaxID=2802975 RepID=A0ABM8HQK4_9BACT|nr:tRNA lysidine(34) synthetase TilS [Desulfuromonas versatilis]BCR04090.1 tRNA(Ile)-lysidine synthase [Desulfuromonas versatilis]